MRTQIGEPKFLTVNGVECEWRPVADPDAPEVCGVLVYPGYLDEETERCLVEAWRKSLNEPEAGL